MENFVRFVKALNLFTIGRDKGLMENYGGTGENFEINMIEGIKECKIFNVDNNVKKLLVLTKPPKKNNKIHLPFESVFIDVNFQKEEMKKLGVNIGYKEIIGVLIKRGKFYNEITGIPVATNIRITIYSNSGYDPNDKEKKAQNFYMFDTFNEQNEPLFDTDGQKFNLREVRIPQTNQKARKSILDFVLNFINFVNNPEIEIVEIARSEKQNKKREEKGKFRIPPQHFIRLKGELKKYINSVGDNHFTYSYRFWVRGFFRKLKHPKYKGNVGKRIWILPFIKGKSGILMEKEYVISKTT